VPRVPQFGWSLVRPSPATPHPGRDAATAPFFREGYAYFANSYRLAPDAAVEAGWEVATADYGGPYVAAMRRGDVIACQFHPELSGPWGHDLLTRWCNAPQTAGV